MADLIEYIVAREHQGDRLTDSGSEVHLFKEGETRLADASIVGTLVQLGVLIEPDEEVIADALRTDGPTVAEYVAAGYQAENYPPEGWASRSTDEEIAAAIAAQSTEKKSEGNSTETKVDPPSETKTPAPAKAPAKAAKAASTKAA